MSLLDDECTGDALNTFERQMTLEFAGNVDEVLVAELNTTENGVRVTYNELAKSTCDPFSPRIVNSTVEEIVPIRPPTLFEEDQSFRVQFLVVGTCRRCTSNTPLFSDAANIARKLNVGSDARRMEDKCACPEGTDAVERAPTTDEYTVAYNEWLDRMHEDGRIDPEHIESTLETVELGNPSAALNGRRLEGLEVGNIVFLGLVVLKMIL